MTHKVEWSGEALANIDEIFEFVAAFNPSAAYRLTQRLTLAGLSLRDFPKRAREVEKGTHELAVVWPFVIRYLVSDEVVRIIRVRHGARQPD